MTDTGGATDTGTVLDLDLDTESGDQAATASAAAAGGTGGPGAGTAHPFGIKGWLTWGWRTLTAMRTALILLFLLALGSIPGSMLPQQGTDPAGVQQYYKSHPSLAPLLNHLGLFNVFGAPWFAAVYLLLFASLIGCVVPRTFRLAGSARTLPPRAPKNVARLPHHATYRTALGPQQAAGAAAGFLAGRGFRLRRDAEWVSAEKGYLREAGNLLFHLALLGVLASIALGGLFGYKADKLVVEGNAFGDTASSLDEFHPGRLVTASDLAPFTLTLNSFNASYLVSGPDRGQPSSFDAKVSYVAAPGGQERSYDLRVNHPLNVDGVQVYLIGHGYAPVFKVTDAAGRVVYNQATPFVAGSSANFLSQGVVKVPDASPGQLGFAGVFIPTAVDVNGTLESVFPAAANPVVSLIGYTGDLGENSGPPQSVYQLDTSAMHKIAAQPQVLAPGQTWKLPNGLGSVAFTGFRQYASIAVTYDPGQLPALACGIMALAGLVLSFLIRRRRVFVRAVARQGGGSTVDFGGLARTDASGGFADEFAELAAQLAAAYAEQDQAAGQHHAAGQDQPAGQDQAAEQDPRAEQEPRTEQEPGAARAKAPAEQHPTGDPDRVR